MGQHTHTIWIGKIVVSLDITAAVGKSKSRVQTVVRKSGFEVETKSRKFLVFLQTTTYEICMFIWNGNKCKNSAFALKKKSPNIRDSPRTFGRVREGWVDMRLVGKMFKARAPTC